MKNKTCVILGNQLFKPEILRANGFTHIYMAEDFGLCTYQKHHKKKIYLFLCAMREYRDELEQCGFEVSYFELKDRKDGLDYVKFLLKFARTNDITQLSFFEIEDKKFELEILCKKKSIPLKIFIVFKSINLIQVNIL